MQAFLPYFLLKCKIYSFARKNLIYRLGSEVFYRYYIIYAKEKGCSLTGPEDMEVQRINVVKGREA